MMARLRHSDTKAPAATKAFSAGRVSLCLLPMLALALWILALDGLATAGGTATSSAMARVEVSIPDAAKSASVVMLELNISVVRAPASGQLGALVRLRPPGGAMVEAGRVSIVGGEQSYQFEVTGALRSAGGGSADVEVAVIDRAGGPPPRGATLSVGRTAIVTR
jgi:hypothetical protein